jgi:hypothetical protein
MNERTTSKAAEHAKANIKKSNQREAFLKHLNNVTEQQPKVKPHRVESKPEKDKQTETGIER